jgi:hypothetical protein
MAPILKSCTQKVGAIPFNNYSKTVAHYARRPGVRYTTLSVAAFTGLVVYAYKKWNILPSMRIAKKYNTISTYSNKISGSYEILSDGSKLCCDIGPNYTVTCYLQSNPTRFVSFDPVGIVGDTSKSSQIDLAAALVTATKKCAAYSIADEAKHLRSPKYAKILKQKAKNGYYSGHYYDCANIGQTRILPTLVDTFKKFSKKCTLLNEPHILIADEQKWENSSCRGNAFALRGCDGGVLTSYDILQQYSDCEQCGVLAHELHHLKQYEQSSLNNYWSYHCYATGNNYEAEADIASVLTSQSPALAVFFNRFDQLPMPTITRDNMQELLKNEIFCSHPSLRARKALVLTMYEHYKRARAQLVDPIEKKSALIKFVGRLCYALRIKKL